ncbi:helix-turn-helix transcriptional regulator [Nocardioides yefusunii]|uniref:Helix-turn-helix transcriptional regulator n=1 Tax=Nocardioides yefusunii TaxID=2500546 RepID=A0ABW1QZV4_9ACTN|nr:DNA-binding protein [Nocardioides yefusunii]
MPENLAGAAEIAELLNVSRQRVHQLTEGDDFPDPVAVLKAGKIWERADVVAWAREHGRTINE